MVKKIHHIGIAVRNIERGIMLYSDCLGLEYLNTDIVEKDGVKVAFLKIGETKIELLEPLNNESPVAKFLEKKGEGFHHICFEVDDVGRSLEKCKHSGIISIDERPREGAEGCLVAFLHPKSCGGVLIELAEPII